MPAVLLSYNIRLVGYKLIIVSTLWQGSATLCPSGRTVEMHLHKSLDFTSGSEGKIGGASERLDAIAQVLHAFDLYLVTMLKYQCSVTYLC